MTDQKPPGAGLILIVAFVTLSIVAVILLGQAVAQR